MNTHRSNPELTDYYLVMQMLQRVDVGLVILDQDSSIHLWNGFMENHSGIKSEKLLHTSLFQVFPDLPQAWIQRKVEAVFKLGSPAYSTWEQRPHLFPFKSYRPLTGLSELMYQNLTFMPLLGLNRAVDKVCLLIYDVTESATSKIQLEKANRQLEELSRTDRLTGLYNRGYWEECLRQEFQRQHKQQHKKPAPNPVSPASLLIFDIDHFKPVNDTYGHLAGDEVIKAVATCLQELSDASHYAGRYGGEEFVLLMPDTSLQEAQDLAEQLRQNLETKIIPYANLTIQITVSLGVCEYDPTFTNYEAWLEAADQALYLSKNQGRNQVTTWIPSLAASLEAATKQ